VNRTARRAGNAGGRKRGEQPGAPGSGLSWVADPHETVAHRPAGGCGCGCGRALSAAADLGVAGSHQVHDVPLVTATVTQHDLHRVRCACGAEHVAVRPVGVLAASTS
jgi:transposase